MTRPVALVTGAAQGIGLETAKRLAATHRLALLDLNAELLDEIRPLCGDDAVAVVCDIAEQDQVTAAVAEVAALDGVRVAGRAPELEAEFAAEGGARPLVIGVPVGEDGERDARPGIRDHREHGGEEGRHE